MPHGKTMCKSFTQKDVILNNIHLLSKYFKDQIRGQVGVWKQSGNKTFGHGVNQDWSDWGNEIDSKLGVRFYGTLCKTFSSIPTVFYSVLG